MPNAPTRRKTTPTAKRGARKATSQAASSVARDGAKAAAKRNGRTKKAAAAATNGQAPSEAALQDLLEALIAAKKGDFSVRLSIRRKGILHTRAVFGLMQDSRVDEEFILGLLARLSSGDWELYSHPSLDQFRHEFDALVSPRVLDCVRQLGIGLIRYQDL